jgi:hypothetical protein
MKQTNKLELILDQLRSIFTMVVGEVNCVGCIIGGLIEKKADIATFQVQLSKGNKLSIDLLLDYMDI